MRNARIVCAAEIDLATVPLSSDDRDGALPAVQRPEPHLMDFDGDTNIELEVSFNAKALQGLRRNTGGDTALLRATWLYTDGTEGTASAQVEVVR